MGDLATVLVFLIIVVNIFIAALGVHRSNLGNWPRTPTGIHSFFAHPIYSLCSSLSLYKQVVFLSCLSVQCAPIDTRVVSMFSVISSPDLTFTIPLPDLQTHWPLWAIREISTRKQPETRKSFYNNCKQVKKNSRGDKGVWYPNSTTVVCGWTNRKGHKSSQTHVFSPGLASLLPKREAQPQTHRHKCWLLSYL